MPEKLAPLPQIQLTDAIKLAEQYLDEFVVEIDSYRLSLAKWDADLETQQWRWQLFWMTACELKEHHRGVNQSATAELIVYVDDDGQVSHLLHT